MASRPAGALPRLSRRSKILIGIGVFILLVLVLGNRLLAKYVDWLWYGEVNFRSVFGTQLVTEIVLFFAAGVFMAGAVLLAMFLAYRTRPVFVPVTGSDDPLTRYRATIVRRRKLFIIGIPALIGLITGWTATAQWQTVQLLFNGGSFGQTDPQFHIDIGFYVFTLPFIQWIKSLLFVAITLSFFAALITHYLFGGIRLAGRGGQISVPARIHLGLLIGLFVLLKAGAYYLDRYEALFSGHSDKFNGASYTDVNALLPAKLILLCIAVFCAVAFFVGAFMRNMQLPAIAFVLMLLSALLVGTVWPLLMQQFSVSANAQQKEAPYIERNIQATRQAYGITGDKIDRIPYDPGKSAKPISQVSQDDPTMSNIRVLDPAILSPTFTQLGAGNKNFYGFPDNLGIDRYTVGGKKQDYIVAAREIDPNKLANTQRDWINKHLVYTHGNGFVAAPANQIKSGDEGGYPDIKVSDLDHPGDGGLRVNQPRIYYGLLNRSPDDYAIVGGGTGAPREYDADNKPKYTYQGSGGVQIGNWFNRLAFAAYYTERNFLFSNDIDDSSRVILKRDPRDRVQAVAPWLTTDGDPYPAVVNGQVEWIVDGYTTLSKYPYSQSTPLAQATNVSTTGGSVRPQEDRNIGYIRNSVKATVNAYTGKVSLYSVDEQDPVLKAWERVFPGTVKPKSAIPPALSEHFRYPEDLFKVQRDLMAKYHVSNPQEFYSQNSFWSVPKDPTYHEENTPAAQPGLRPSREAPGQPPYYVLAQAPGQRSPTFQLTSTFTPLNRQNMAGWLSASSDPRNYGKFTMLTLPSGAQTRGPFQTQNAFDTNPAFTTDRTLFGNKDVEPKFGNLLTLPVAGGIMYVEPVYIQRNGQDSYPNLAKVLVSYNNQVGVGNNLQDALNKLTPGSDSTPGSDQGNEGQQPPPSSSSQPPPSGGGGGGVSPQLSSAVRDIQGALEQVRDAQRSGDFGKLGEAYKQLDEATKRFESAQGNQSGANGGQSGGG
ncbi:UPF0182 family protein [Sciscionella sediminilitoris]|uniref:UPF0182 family protein n=1 Tax=Sciscionella sediminilitoris TaxID=1445613 RepID=UPI0004DF79B3|nr:UPF0182 family protein [Sciscionella sp. SE31]